MNILEKENKKVVLLGNEAIVRGALESGVDFVSVYPGTPSSEIGNIFFKLSQLKKFKGYFEFSTNEKVALEAGIGASFSGLKVLVAMKNFGANVALDALAPFAYTGSKGATVIIIADDPSCHSSGQSEENSRGFAQLVHLPILEPATAQENKEFVKQAFQLSEKFNIPVIVRITTRAAHQRSLVSLAEIKTSKTKGFFKKDKNQFVTLPPRVLEMKKELFEKLEKIKNLAEKSIINKIVKNNSSHSKIGVITSGVSYLNVMEALKETKTNLPVLKLGFFNPLPENKIKNFIKGLKKVLIVEELEPYLENEVTRLAKQVNCQLEVIGKKLFSQIGEITPDQTVQAIAQLTGKKLKIKKILEKQADQLEIPKRMPRLCPGCPYWLVISALKKAVDPKKVIFGGEIGCYMLLGMPSVNMQDYLFCMGSSVGIGHGIRKSTNQKLISFIGDSSFFHAAIPALINAVTNKSSLLIIILENQTTAMTGHQPHPGAPGSGEPGIKIENIVKACGVNYVKTIDPVNQKEFVDTLKSFLNKPEVSVIISKKPCIQIKK
jgi:indolepyruvate ferredoxin oxidoreductase, alpha subunit